MDIENEIEVLREQLAEKSSNCVHLLKEVWLTHADFGNFSCHFYSRPDWNQLLQYEFAVNHTVHCGACWKQNTARAHQFYVKVYEDRIIYQLCSLLSFF